MKTILKAALAGLPLLALGSCASEKFEPNDPTIAEKSETRYLRVNLVNNGETNRAMDYADGTEEENKIRAIDFYFYDSDKHYHSHVPLSVGTENDPTADPTTPGNEHVYGFYETNVPVEIVQGEKMPTYVLCIVNAVNGSRFESYDLVEAQKAVLNSFYYESGDKYFAMNNSVYYGRDEVTGLDNQLIMATPFDSNKLKTESEIDKMEPDDKEANTIDIYVERYAAKVNFNLTDGAVQDYVSANGVTLTFVPKGWKMNCFEESFYLLKSYRAIDDVAGQAAPVYSSFEDMNGVLSWEWNKPEHFRSFWARTPGYYSNNYPVVADDILDAEKYPYNVYYSHFNDKDFKAVNSSLYMMESTMQGNRLTGNGMGDQYLPLTSIPSVVLAGQYKVNGSDNKITFYAYQTGANDKVNIYADKAGDLGEISTISNVMLSAQTIVLKKNGNSYQSVRPSDLAAASTVFTVKHPEKSVRENLKIGGDLVTLQVSATDSGYYYYDRETNDYQLITDANINIVNRLLYQNLGGAHKFTNGMAFFSAPIQHWGWQRTGNENAGKTMDEWDWTKMKTGDFGIVRNHVYTLEVSKIAGLGTGIINPSDPMLPPTDKVGYAVHFHINIQKWATLPKQTWEW